MIRKKELKCALFGHKWRPVFISGEYNGIKVKFIGCYCARCNFGDNELTQTILSQTKIKYSTYEKSFFIGVTT